MNTRYIFSKMPIIFIVKHLVFEVSHIFNCLYFNKLIYVKKFANDLPLLVFLWSCEIKVKKLTFFGCKFNLFSQIIQTFLHFSSLSKNFERSKIGAISIND